MATLWLLKKPGFYHDGVAFLLKFITYINAYNLVFSLIFETSHFLELLRDHDDDDYEDNQLIPHQTAIHRNNALYPILALVLVVENDSFCSKLIISFLPCSFHIFQSYHSQIICITQKGFIASTCKLKEIACINHKCLATINLTINKRICIDIRIYSIILHQYHVQTM